MYGMRVLQLRDSYNKMFLGSILGDSYWNTTADNSIFGPQLGLVWSERRGPLHIEAQGAAILGYNAVRAKL